MATTPGATASAADAAAAADSDGDGDGDGDGDAPVASGQVAFLEREAARVHLEAQALNKSGRFEEATAAYAEMNALERRALELAAAAATCASCDTETERQDALAGSARERERRWPAHSSVASPGDAYGATLAAARFRDPEARRRAAAAICGAYAADCASVGVQWIYDGSALEALLAEERRKKKGASPAVAAALDASSAADAASGGDAAAGEPDDDVGLEFLDPVASPFLAADYATGRPSPYGEETLVLIRALAADAARGGGGGGDGGDGGGGAQAWGLHCGDYAERYARAFGAGFKGYMNASTRAFLRNYGASGLPPPWSGADDKQADCVARVAPLVAAFGGSGGGAGAGAEEQARGASGGGTGGPTPVAPAAPWAPRSPPPPPPPPLLLLERATEMATRVTQNEDAAVGWACAAALVLRGVVLGARVEDAARGVAERLEGWGARGGGGGEAQELRGGGGGGRAAAAAGERAAPSVPSPPPLALPMAPALALDIAARMREALSRAASGTTPEQAAAVFGRNCHLPNSYQTPLHAALWGERVHEKGGGGGEGGGRGGGERAGEAAFAAAIRGALRGGGCCSSRAQAAGALLAARLGKGAIPAGWRDRCWDWGEVEQAAEAIAGR